MTFDRLCKCCNHKILYINTQAQLRDIFYFWSVFDNMKELKK